mgnify:CR=1 FL=1
MASGSFSGYSQLLITGSLDESQVQEILNRVVLDMGDYRQIYNVLSEYVKQLEQYMVVVTGTKSDTDWFANV